MTNANSNVAPPHINNRRSSAVIARVHAEVVLLPKARFEGQHPIRTFFVRSALIRPERRYSSSWLRANRVRIIAPAQNAYVLRSRVCIAHIEHGKRREVIVNRHCDAFLQAAGLAGYG